MSQSIVTIPWKSEDYPVDKDHRYKFMIPLMVERIGKVWYHTFRVTAFTAEEKTEELIYGDCSSDFD